MIRFAVILCASAVVAGCASDPLQGVPRLSETDVSDSEIQAAIRAEPDAGSVLAPAPRQGFLGRVLGGGAQATPTPVPPAPEVKANAGADVDVVVEATAPPAPVQPAQRGGLLGFLQRAADDAQSEPSEPQRVATATSTGGGLFGGNRASAGPKPGDPDYQSVSLGTVLPYGVMARVCEARPRQMGKRVDQYPDGGKAYTLYDSDPGSTAPHTYYLTGFDDGCARQFTAALVVFGSPQTHEQLRYGLPSKVQPYSKTDAAYEQVKSRVCRVSKGKPCGSAINRLSRNTAFVSVYEQFGSNPVWKTILLHDGEVVETDIRSN